MYVPVKRVSSDVQMPEYQSEGASGFDLHAYMENSVFIEPRSINIIPTGLHFSIPSGYELQVRSRSGLAANQGVMVLNSPGTVDSDYRGELKVILFNHSNKEFIVNHNDRIAQIVLVPVLKVDFEEVDTLPDTLRGSGGFGSTG